MKIERQGTGSRKRKFDSLDLTVGGRESIWLVVRMPEGPSSQLLELEVATSDERWHFTVGAM